MDRFCKRCRFLTTYQLRWLYKWQYLLIFNWSPRTNLVWQRTHLLKEKKIEKKLLSQWLCWILEEKETGWPDLIQEQGLICKAGVTVLEGQTYEFMTGNDTIVSMGRRESMFPRRHFAILETFCLFSFFVSLSRRRIYERLKPKTEGSTRLSYTGFCGGMKHQRRVSCLLWIDKVRS